MAVITISQGTHSGAYEVAERVGRELGLPVIERAFIVQAAEEAGLRSDVLSEVLHRRFSIFERFASERDAYRAFVRATLCQRAAEGGFVYVGHNAQLLLQDLPHLLSVRVIAPLAYRVKVVCEKKGCAEGEALKEIRRLDEDRRKWTRFLYDVEWGDPSLYDLVLSLDRLNEDDAAALVIQAVQRECFRETEEVKRKVADLTLASQVAAHLHQHEGLEHQDVSVSAVDGVVTLQGAVRESSQRQSLEGAAQNVAGVQEVVCAIRVPSDVLRD